MCRIGFSTVGRTNGGRHARESGRYCEQLGPHLRLTASATDIHSCNSDRKRQTMNCAAILSSLLTSVRSCGGGCGYPADLIKDKVKSRGQSILTLDKCKFGMCDLTVEARPVGGQTSTHRRIVFSVASRALRHQRLVRSQHSSDPKDASDELAPEYCTGRILEIVAGRTLGPHDVAGTRIRYNQAREGE